MLALEAIRTALATVPVSRLKATLVWCNHSSRQSAFHLMRRERPDSLALTS